MAKFIMLTRFVILNIFNLTAFPLMQITANLSAEPPVFIFWFINIMMWLPEFTALISKGFRAWIKTGIENGDGVLNSRDMNGLLIFWTSSICMKLLALVVSHELFFGSEIGIDTKMILVMGATGGQGIGAVRTLILRKYK